MPKKKISPNPAAEFLDTYIYVYIYITTNLTETETPLPIFHWTHRHQKTTRRNFMKLQDQTLHDHSSFPTRLSENSADPSARDALVTRDHRRKGQYRLPLWYGPHGLPCDDYHLHNPLGRNMQTWVRKMKVAQA